MKKVFLALAAILMSAAFVSAQDLASVTETYNNGASQLAEGDRAAALASFQDALKAAEALGDEGAEIVANCKNIIPAVVLSMGKELFNNKDFTAAADKFQEAVKIAKDYGVDEVELEAEPLIPAAYFSAGRAAIQAKDMAAAAESLKKAIEIDPGYSNGNAALYLGQALNSAGDVEGAKEAFNLAMANGQEENAKKQLGNIVLKDAQAALKDGKNADVVSMISKADEEGLISNAAAYQLAASASQKLNKTADAIKYYEKFLEADPKNKNFGAIAYTVGALYQGQNNKAKALEFYKKAVTAGYADAQKMVDALNK
ncbi:MAG: tetratricopeptide repeat protein [Bacteroidales bacterium]|nr:tetratricopeptide repeat protein [Bacteroidales bacterium]